VILSAIEEGANLCTEWHGSWSQVRLSGLEWIGNDLRKSAFSKESVDRDL
jgi:hypothetical protein